MNQNKHSVIHFLLYHFVPLSQAKVNIIAGCCMAVGLRFAGSANQEAFNCLVCFLIDHHIICLTSWESFLNQIEGTEYKTHVRSSEMVTPFLLSISLMFSYCSKTFFFLFFHLNSRTLLYLWKYQNNFSKMYFSYSALLGCFSFHQRCQKFGLESRWTSNFPGNSVCKFWKF